MPPTPSSPFDSWFGSSLFTRLCNRHELQLVLMTSAEVTALTHAQMQAWGTSGLEPHELRGVYHALLRSPPSGRPAQLFIARLKERVAALPPPADADDADSAVGGADTLSEVGSTVSTSVSTSVSSASKLRL